MLEIDESKIHYHYKIYTPIKGKEFVLSHTFAHLAWFKYIYALFIVDLYKSVHKDILLCIPHIDEEYLKHYTTITPVFETSDNIHYRLTNLGREGISEYAKIQQEIDEAVKKEEEWENNKKLFDVIKDFEKE